MGGLRAGGRARRLEIAVVGSGISGLSAAWLLAQTHAVTVFEADGRIGGHSNTVDVFAGGAQIAVDTGFIVYNEPAYPNLTALFAELGVLTDATEMSFAVSLESGGFEYAGSDLPGLLAQPGNLLKARFWAMLRDIRRFYRNAEGDVAQLGDVDLDTYLDRGGYSRAFRDDHLYPMAAAIWSTPAMEVGRYPAQSFIRFCANHGLLQITGRPVWRTVRGGSRAYVKRLTAPFADRLCRSTPAVCVRRDECGVEIVDGRGGKQRFDAVVLACHGDTALRLLETPSIDERRLLGAIRYTRNEAVLHGDTSFMPKRRAAWASWNYVAGRGDDARQLSVTYWMNRLQRLGSAPPLFVTLNPVREPRPGTVLRTDVYEHPAFDLETLRAQKNLWSLQGRQNTWFCGAYFGAGFHEDGLQAGLAVGEDLGGRKRPWQVANDSGRIYRTPVVPSPHLAAEVLP
ncbi:MAG: NAD(P)/FAD-dependent oxidoreductase [Hyphomicrobiaceae bacterium]